MAIELSPENQQAYDHYRRCRAVNRWPEDPIVERDAAIIRDIEDIAHKVEIQSMFMTAALSGK